MTATTFDINDKLYEILQPGSFKSAISGDVYKQERPINSDLEDGVINTLPITNEQLQVCTANLNIYVPDIEVTVAGQVNKMPDHARMKQLAKLAIEDLKYGISGDYTWDIQWQHVFKDEDSGQHYVNIRINFFVSNI